jgi:FixJ family two-component response regulator
LLYTDGFEPVLFRSAEEYLEGASVLCPLCLLLDLNLPGLSGLQLQERLRRTAHAPRIIVITSRRNPAIRALAEENGCAAFLVKPFGATTLPDAIASIDASRSFSFGESENDAGLT